jgi:2-oxoglutarate ferredoxin oxidoreductase subunit beta
VRLVKGRPRCLTGAGFLYCPGCHHGIVLRLVAETIDELGIAAKAVMVTSIGCSVRCWTNLDIDACQGAHGRGLAVATGIKRASPGSVVFTYQGDGDLAAIGMAETLHAAARGEAVTVIFVNNAVFGATGGQMAPTTLLGMKTSTYPEGRDPRHTGYPIRVAELLASLEGVTYSARVAVNSPARVREASRAVRKAFLAQVDKEGFGIVEVLSACPVNLKISPVKALKWIDDAMIPCFPLGVFQER